MLWLWLLGCQTMGSLVPVSGPVGNDGTTNASTSWSTSTSTSPVVPSLSVTAEVVDPLFGDIAWSVSGLLDGEGSLSIEGSDGVVYTETYGATTKDATGSWDGRLGDGSWAGLGRYTLRLTVAGQVVAETSAALVRAGLTAAYAEDDDGLTSRRVDMYWWEDSTRQSEGYPITGLEKLEDADTQTPCPLRLYRTSCGSVRTSKAHSGSRTYDSRPLLTVEVGGAEDTFFGATGLDAASLRGGFGLDGPGRWCADGGWALTLMRDAPLSEEGTVGVTEELVTFSFVHDGENGPQLVGTQTLPLLMYRVLGAATFEHSGERYTAWAEALDELLPFIEGTTAEHDAVANAVVDYVYHETGLEYDTRRGASAYSDYDWGWDPHVYFSDFLQRRFGTTINCTDAGNLVTTYSNMVGAELRHLIILENFALDEIKAIGIDEYTSCPFGPGGCGFSYHAVTTDDGGGTIWDATLALDGDDDPGSAPHEVMMVQAIDGEEYLNRLVRDDFAYYDYENEGTIQ